MVLSTSPPTARDLPARRAATRPLHGEGRRRAAARLSGRRTGASFVSRLGRLDGWLAGRVSDAGLLGNLGLNSDLRATEKEPASLYVYDFDRNFFTDPILTYYKQNQPYSYASMDELTNQMPILRKKFTQYATFAKGNFQQIFDEKDLTRAQRMDAHTFASAYAKNNGDGSFSLKALPLAAQVAPIFAFAVLDTDGDGKSEVLATGNFYNAHPALGRYDASRGHFLKMKPGGDFEAIDFQKSGFASNGEGRGLNVIKTANGRLLVIAARNNLPVQVFWIK